MTPSTSTSKPLRAGLVLAVLASSFHLACATAAAKPTEADCAAMAPDDGLNKLTDEQLVRKMLEVTGAADLGKQVSDAMADSFAKLPNLPAGFAEKFKSNVHPEALVELIIPIYLKHYNRDTLKAAIRFYQSPEGREITRTLPLLTAESMEAGKAWGTEVAKKTFEDLGIH